MATTTSGIILEALQFMDYSTSRSNKFLAPIMPTFVALRSLLNSSLVPKALMTKNYFLFNRRDCVDSYLQLLADFSQTMQFTSSLLLTHSQFDGEEGDSRPRVTSLLQKLVRGTPYFRKSLQTLIIVHAPAEVFQLLAEITSLKSLTFASSQFVEAGHIQKFLEKVQNPLVFEELSFSNFTQLRSEHVRPLEKFTNLKKLNLASCSGLTDFSFLANLANLKFLSLDWANGFDDDQARYLQNLVNLETFRRVSEGRSNPRDETIFTDHGVSFLGNLTNLTHVNVLGNVRLTDSCLTKTFSKLPHLNSLNITFCSSISRRAKDKLKEQLGAGFELIEAPKNPRWAMIYRS